VRDDIVVQTQQLMYVRYFDTPSTGPSRCPISQLERLQLLKGSKAFAVIPVATVNHLAHIIPDMRLGGDNYLLNRYALTLSSAPDTAWLASRQPKRVRGSSSAESDVSAEARATRRRVDHDSEDGSGGEADAAANSNGHGSDSDSDRAFDDDVSDSESEHDEEDAFEDESD